MGRYCDRAQSDWKNGKEFSSQGKVNKSWRDWKKREISDKRVLLCFSDI